MPSKQYDELVDAQPVREHLVKLHAAGMSSRRIGELAGVSTSRVQGIIRGAGPSREPLRKVTTYLYVALMAVAYEPPAPQLPPSYLLDPTGTRRRLQALCADGFTTAGIATLTGISTPIVYRHTTAAPSPVHEQTRDRVRDGYDTALCVDPRSLGILDSQIKRVASIARRKGFAPRVCWDEDTIDDPAAIPEWTGACGTYSGWMIHRRENIPVCAACHAAARGCDAEDPVFDAAKFRAARERCGYTQKSLAAASGVCSRSIARWELEQGYPSPELLDSVCIHLDQTSGELWIDPVTEREN